jgi:hypothetical protein
MEKKNWENSYASIWRNNKQLQNEWCIRKRWIQNTIIKQAVAEIYVKLYTTKTKLRKL